MKKITIIGTGYVGLVSGSGIAEFGNKVICVDIDEKKIKQLNDGLIPIYEPGLESLVSENVKKGRLSFSSKIGQSIEDSEIIFIAVGTPQDVNGTVDLSAVKTVAKTIGNHLNDYKIIATKSTVPIGTGKLIESIIRSQNKGANIDYVSNPEFLREGAAVKDFLNPDRVVLGTRTKKADSVFRDIYRPLYLNETPILSTTVETAEMIKYASNAFLALKISYINEIANLCDKVGADVHVVSKAMGQDGRISPKFLHPGPGYGGSCFPKDTKALVASGREYQTPIHTIEAAIKTNKNQKLKMVDKLLKLMEGDLANKTVAVLGLAFKPQTDDVRDAASLVIIPELIDKGASVHAYDPIATKNFKSYYKNISYFDCWQDAVLGVDGVIILTEWNEFRGMDLDDLKSRMAQPVVLDAKNILSIKKLQSLNSETISNNHLQKHTDNILSKL